VSLKGGVGQAGDGYERNADGVAERVVRGESAEALLAPFAGSGGHAVQRAVQLDGRGTRRRREAADDGTPTRTQTEEVQVGYSSDYENEFVGNAARAIGRWIYYRTDGGELARDMVRNNSNLREIFDQLPADTAGSVQLRAHITRRLEPGPNQNEILIIRWELIGPRRPDPPPQPTPEPTPPPERPPAVDLGPANNALRAAWNQLRERARGQGYEGGGMGESRRDLGEVMLRGYLGAWDRTIHREPPPALRSPVEQGEAAFERAWGGLAQEQRHAALENTERMRPLRRQLEAELADFLRERQRTEAEGRPPFPGSQAGGRGVVERTNRGRSRPGQIRPPMRWFPDPDAPGYFTPQDFNQADVREEVFGDRDRVDVDRLAQWRSQGQLPGWSEAALEYFRARQGRIPTERF
jgi:hypothetical protein